MSSRNSASTSSPASQSDCAAGSSARRRLVASLWASSFVVLHAASILAQSLDAVSTDAKASLCGPIADTIEYVLWLLQQL